MAANEEKKLSDLKTFIDGVNKKTEKRHGLRVCFAFVKRKRKK